jgi:pilus assembly protein CpaB
MNRRLITIIIALVLAGAGTLGVFSYVQRADDRAVAGNRPVAVLVAAQSIPAGTSIDSLQAGGFLRTRNYPAASVPDDALSKITPDLKRLVMAGTVGKGELITVSQMAEKGASQAFVIPEGHIALTISMGEAQRVANYAKPGTKVTVFVAFRTIHTKGTGDKKETKTSVTSRILMSDIPVLAVGPATADLSGQDVANNRELMTLGVTQEQAEKLILGATTAGDGSGPGDGNGLYMALQTDSSELNVKSKGVTNFTIVK